MRSIVASGLVLFLCSAAWAGPVLDQQQESENGGTTFFVDRTLAQTFTAGLSGQLTAIELGMYNEGNYPSTIEIRTTASGMPTDTVLGSVFMADGLANGWNMIDFSGENIFVDAGTLYSFVLSNDEPPQIYSEWLHVRWDGASYSAGQLFENGGAGWNASLALGLADAQFRTYVDAGSTVPAPGAIVLVGIGSTLATWLRRRRAL